MIEQYFTENADEGIDSNSTVMEDCDIKSIDELLQRLLQAADEQWRMLPPNQRVKPMYVSDIKYYLYTRAKGEKPFLITNGSLAMLESKESYFNKKNLNVFITHGFRNNYESDVNTIIQPAVLEKEDANVFVVDWSSHSYNILFYKDPLSFACRVAFSVDLDYYAMVSRNAFSYTIRLGEIVGDFIIGMMKKFEIDTSNFLLVGHSLGAHTSGCIGARVKNITNKLIKSIIGLDPPYYWFHQDEYLPYRIKASDGEYVHVIHTSSFGFSTQVGLADYYPTGGNCQPACCYLWCKICYPVCDHSMSYHYYAESITRNEFMAYRCSSFAEYSRSKCFQNPKSSMGTLSIDTKARGNYFLSVSGKSPYGVGDPKSPKGGSTLLAASTINTFIIEIVKCILVKTNFINT